MLKSGSTKKSDDQRAHNQFGHWAVRIPFLLRQQTMHLLLIGSGGREHAMAWKLAQAENVTRISVAPGNPGMQQESKIENVDINALDIDALLAFAQSESVHLTIVGPRSTLGGRCCRCIHRCRATDIRPVSSCCAIGR